MASIEERLDTARQNIRIAAALRGENLSELSRKAGMSRNGLSQFTTGRTVLSYANMVAACDALGVPIALIDKPDAITQERIRLWRNLERMPPHLVAQAMAMVQETLDPRRQAPQGDH